MGFILPAVDCGLRIDDCGFSEWRFEIEIVDCGLARLNQQSAIGNLNRQSTIQKSAIAIPQSAIRSSR
jgi:hypothetical protein